MSEAGKHRVWVVVFLAAGWAAFGAYRIWQAVVAPAAVWQDSLGYRAVSTHGILSGALWAGPRSPLVPLLLKLTHGFADYAVVQAIIATAAWGILALTVSRLVPEGWRSVVMAWAVLGFATAPLVVQWDWSVLSESPSLSALALLCASGIWLVWGFSWIRLTTMGVAAAAYVGLRDADIWTVGVVGVVLLVVGLYETIHGAALGPGALTHAIRAKWGQSRRWVLVGVVLLSLASVAGVGADASHRNGLNIEEALYVRVFPFPDRVAWFSSHGMPDGSAIDALARTTVPAAHSAKIVAPDLSDPSWQPLLSWFDHQGEMTYAFFLVTHPLYDLTAPFASPALTYNNASGDLSFYLPVGHQPLGFLEAVFVPNHVVVIVLAVLAFLLVSTRTRRRREWRFLVFFAAVGLFSMLLAWHGEGMEVTRHMVEGNVEVRLGVLLMILLAVLGHGRSHEEATESGATVPASEATDPSAASEPSEPVSSEKELSPAPSLESASVPMVEVEEPLAR